MLDMVITPSGFRCSAQGALSTHGRYDRAGHWITDRRLKTPFGDAEQSLPAAPTKRCAAQAQIAEAFASVMSGDERRRRECQAAAGARRSRQMKPQRERRIRNLSVRTSETFPSGQKIAAPALCWPARRASRIIAKSFQWRERGRFEWRLLVDRLSPMRRWQGPCARGPRPLIRSLPQRRYLPPEQGGPQWLGEQFAVSGIVSARCCLSMAGDIEDLYVGARQARLACELEPGDNPHHDVSEQHVYMTLGENAERLMAGRRR